MSTLVHVEGNLLEIAREPATLIVQQINCGTIKSHGLSRSIKDRFGIDPYERKPRSSNVARDFYIPGHARIITRNDVHVACLTGQVSPGNLRKPYLLKLYPVPRDGKDDKPIQETYKLREEWFRSALRELTTVVLSYGTTITTVAFPYQIGCGLAGGKWESYELMIEAFAETMPEKKVVIVRLPK